MDSRTHKTISPAFIKPEILKADYSLYLNSLSTQEIRDNISLSLGVDFSTDDIDEILDYMNELYV